MSTDMESSNIVEVTYAGTISATRDMALEDIAKECDGECQGGMLWLIGQPTRDLQFSFNTLDQAREFAKRAERLEWTDSVLIQSYSFNEDGYVRDDDGIPFE